MREPREPAQEPAIKVENLSKTFFVRGVKVHFAPIPLSLPSARREDDVDDVDDEDDEDEESLDDQIDDEDSHWRSVRALDDLTFEIATGASVGIFGRPGSGKTTLLKIMARVSPPSAGRVIIRGRVAPLLVTASAMLVPESTGRDNVRSLARLYGLPSVLALERMDEIFAFADLTGKEDHPLRTYSSRQYRRLGLSIALHLDSDILLADENLVSGDPDFSERVVELVNNSSKKGLTLLYASHDMDAIREFCNEVIWLEEGRILARATPNEIEEATEAGLEAHKVSRRAADRRVGEIHQLDTRQNELLALLCRNRHTYREAARMLGGDAVELRQEAHTALKKIAPEIGALSDRDVGKIADYLLHQLSGASATAMRVRIAASPRSRAWALVAAGELLRRGIGVPPEIPAKGAAVELDAESTAASDSALEKTATEHAALGVTEILDASGEPVAAVSTGDAVELRIGIVTTEPRVGLRCRIIMSAPGARTLRFVQPEGVRTGDVGHYLVSATLPGELLEDGSYRGRLSVRTARGRQKESMDRRSAFMLEVSDTGGDEPDDEDDLEPAQLSEMDVEWSMTGPLPDAD